MRCLAQETETNESTLMEIDNNQNYFGSTVCAGAAPNVPRKALALDNVSP